MKRILLFTAFCWAAATSVSFAKTPAPREAVVRPSDTIQIKLADGATLSLTVKNTGQLKTFRQYSLDSLMVLLDKYVQQVEAMSKANTGGNSSEISMTFYPAKDLNNPQAPEQVKIRVASSGNTSNKQTRTHKVGDIVKVEVDYEEEGNGKRSNHTVNVSYHDNSDSLKKIRQERKANRRDRVEGNLDLGLNTFVNVPDENSGLYDLKPTGSRYVSINQYISTRLGGPKSPLHLRTGIEVAFNNYMFVKNHRIQDLNNVTVFYNDETRSLEKSKLTASSVNLPLVVELNFKDRNGKESFTIGGGGFIGYRLGSHTKIKFQSEGNTYKDKERGTYNLEDMQYGVNFVLGYKWLSLFGKYNLNDLFKDNRGPNMNVVSFGFRI